MISCVCIPSASHHLPSSLLHYFCLQAEMLDSRVYASNPELLESLSAPGTSDLFAWLRSAHTSDGNFQPSVEMAVGKSELETPPELWISPDDDNIDDSKDDDDDNDNQLSENVGDTSNDAGAATTSATAAIVTDSEVSSSSIMHAKDTAAAVKEDGFKAKSSSVKQHQELHGPRGGSNLQEVGRPDEAKLSMLGAIRSRFHKLIFREGSEDDDAPCHSPLEFDSIQHALTYLSDSNTIASPSSSKPTASTTSTRDTIKQSPDASMIDAIKACVAVRLPLAELLDDESNNTAPNRLTALLQPAWRALWVVETSSASSKIDNGAAASGNNYSSSNSNVGLGSAVRLEYEIPRNKGRTLRGSQSLGELSDFQV